MRIDDFDKATVRQDAALPRRAGISMIALDIARSLLGR